MIKEFVLNHLFMCSILLFGLISVFVQAIMTSALKGYVKASSNMKTTRKKVMLNLKNQFETIYGMDYQVRNIAAYVDKYLLKLKFLGISFASWEKAPFLSAGLATLLAGGGIFYGYINKVTNRAQIEILFSYGLVLVCFFVFFHIFGVKSKKQQIHVQLVDYLENYLTNRLIRTQEGNKELKLLDADMEEAFMEGAARNKELKQVILENEKEQEVPSQTEDMEMLKKLIRDMEQNRAKTNEEQIARSEELQKEEQIAVSEEIEEEEEEKSEIELLEEFVQSFLA